MLIWKDYGTDINGKKSETYIGGKPQICISCVCNHRVFKDGSRQYMIYLSIPGADSKEIITITKVRGNLDDAKAKVESFVQELKKSLTSENDTKVYVTCYGKREAFKNKDEAINFFIERVVNSEGAERERYDRIVDQLIMGKTECTDEEF